MIRPLLQGDALLANINDAAALEPDKLHLWWLGQSGFLVLWKGQLALLDPYLSDSLTTKYRDTDKPHVRMSERVIEPDRLDDVALITSSHNHTDHLDADTLVPIIRASGPDLRLAAPEANKKFVFERLGVGDRLKESDFHFIGLDDAATAAVGPFTLIGVPAAHEQIDQDDQGRHRTIGLILRCGPHTIYHSGDTMLYDGIAGKLRPFNVDVALLPINGRVPERRVAGNMNGAEAAQLAKDIGAKVVIPHHYDLFEFNTADPDTEFVPACKKLEQPCRVLQLGERFTI